MSWAARILKITHTQIPILLGEADGGTDAPTRSGTSRPLVKPPGSRREALALSLPPAHFVERGEGEIDLFWVGRGTEVRRGLALFGRLNELKPRPPTGGASVRPVQVDQADGAVRAQLERVKTFLVDQRWKDAVATLRQLTESSEEKLLGVAKHRFVGLQ